MLTVPNIITLLRVLLVPVIVFLVVERDYGAALAVFLLSALSDLLDGVIARRFNRMSQFGAVLDPLADKLTMLAAVIVLTWQGLLPLWLATAIVVRDVVIVGGAAAYRLLFGRVEMAPTGLSKLNTFLEFALVCMVLAAAAGYTAVSPGLAPAFVLVLLTVTASGLHYVWQWSRMAARQARRRE
ncbi:MAG: CDP-alcohol phosphatidyltransferase family protein [Betaproteobacteria bacterium]|nr:CDP-alcohol phosphatidyltransferase family protein [Betaproteobacteria bacterium]